MKNRRFVVEYDSKGQVRLLNEQGLEEKFLYPLFVIQDLISVYGEKRYIYLVNEAWDEDRIKIGVTGDLNRRCRELGYFTTLINSIPCKKEAGFKLESRLHRCLQQFREKGEWFRFKGDGEAYLSDLKQIRSERELRDWMIYLEDGRIPPFIGVRDDKIERGL